MTEVKLLNTFSPCKNHWFFFTSDWYLHQQLTIASYSFWLSLSLLPPCFNNIIHRSLINVLPPVQLNSSIFASSSKENEVIAESDNLIFVNDAICAIMLPESGFYSVACMFAWEPTSYLRGGMGYTKSPNKTNFIVDSTSVCIMCICFQTHTVIRIHMWTSTDGQKDTCPFP